MRINSNNMAAPCDHVAREKIVVSLRSGATLVRSQPVFSHDSKILFCCSGAVVKVFSTVSGECIRELTGHRLLVTSIKLNPRNKLQLLSCSLDKTVIQWDYSDGILLRQYQLPYPLCGMLTLGQTENAVLGIQQKSKQEFELVKFYLEVPISSTSKLKPHVLMKKCPQDERYVAVGVQEKFIVAVCDKRMRVKYMKKDTQQEHFLETGKSFTCVACHPVDHCIATGVSDGSIYFWWNFMRNERVVKSVSHWHSLPVGDLSFTLEGSYILSGGHECTLVKWHYNTQHRDFFPRLGAPINHVICSHDNTMYATCHTNNTIQIISSNFKLLQVYQGLTKAYLDTQLQDPIPTGLCCDPRSKAIVLNGSPGHIQFFSPHTDTQLFNLDIVCQNYISPENLKKPSVITDVTRAAFDSRGDWLATVQIWDDGEMTPEISLKFWEFTKQSQTYTLNTTVELPHLKKIESLLFRPYNTGVHTDSQPFAVTTSSDGKFKLWVLVDDTDIYRTNTKWDFESLGFFRDIPAGEASFSEDGSLLAVGFGSTVTLWDPDNNLLKHTLINPLDRQSIRHLMFGRRGCCHLLVSATSTELIVWNLLTCAVHWSVDLQSSVLVSDPQTDIMAALSVNKDLFVFKPSNPTPLFSKASISNSDIIGAVFIPHLQESSYSESLLSWQCQSQLYFINKEQQLLTLNLEEECLEEKTTLQTTMQPNLPQTPFSLLMAEKRKAGSMEQITTEYDANLGQPGSAFVREMLSTAPHVQPPVTSLCNSFLHSLLIRKKKSSGSSGDEEEEEEENDHLGLDRLKSDSGIYDSDSDMEIDSENTFQSHSKPQTVSKQMAQTKTISRLTSGPKAVSGQSDEPETVIIQPDEIEGTCSTESFQDSEKSIRSVLKRNMNWYLESKVLKS